MDKLDDLEYEQDRREIDREMEKLLRMRNSQRQDNQTSRQVTQIQSIRSKVVQNPQKYRLIEKNNRVSLYVELPIKRDGKLIEIDMVGFSDEILTYENIKYSEIRTSLLIACNVHNITVILPRFYNFDGKYVGSGPEYESIWTSSDKNKFWVKVEKMYCK
jgi:hypothetical protein